ncbi:MAG TPA: cytochrome c biogenesis protein CcdA [Ilumatobacter sp.]|nr:cytochrome c biogenesis protein CcdA [Ilumatobacter sp.]
MSNLNIGYSFMLGVFAAVNPCGFAMLPAYLSVYLDSDPTTRPTAGIRRALVVSAAVSGGFLTVFAIVGFLIRQSTAFDPLYTQARWAGLVVGVAMATAGIAMLAGWRPPIVPTARLTGSARTDRSVRSMYLFGVAYAIASIGCTIGLFLSVVMSSFTRHGVLAGTLTIATYGVGMGLLVTALTVTLAVARTGLTSRLRNLTRHTHRLSAIIVTLTGGYLAWYWYTAIFHPTSSDPLTGTVGGWQRSLVSWLTRYNALTIAITLAIIVVAATAFSRARTPDRHRQIDRSPR